MGMWLVLLFCGITLAQELEFTLRQSDFDSGSYIIRSPGIYTFIEDVVFKPGLPELELLDVDNIEKPELFLFPSERQRFENDKAFNLGFFAALVVSADDVIIDLNGFRFSQSHIHGAMQRFFALVELANSPFPPNAGPAEFTSVPVFTGAKNVTVKNGVLGRSSHHGIHCNSCKDVLLQDLVIEDFEVGGVSLNAADNVVVNNVVVQKNSRDIRYSGHLSNIIFSLQALTLHIEPFIDIPEEIEDELEKYRTMARKCLKEVLEFEVELEISGSQFDYEAVNRGLRTLHPIIRTVTGGLPDGSLVTGLLFHASVNTGDFKAILAEDQVENILLKDVTIRDLALKTQELTLLRSVNGTNVADMIGAGFNLDAVRDLASDNIPCVLNPLAGFQTALTKLRLLLEDDKDLDPSVKRLFARDGIPKPVLDWCDDKITWLELVQSKEFKIPANKDIMFHQNKGVIGIKVDQSTVVKFENVVIENLQNHADRRAFFFENKPFASEDNLESILFDDESNFAVNTRGVSLAATVDVSGDIEVKGLFSKDVIRTTFIDYINFNEDVGLRLTKSEKCPDKDANLTGQLDILPGFLNLIQRSEFQDISTELFEIEVDVLSFLVGVGIISGIILTLLVVLLCHLQNPMKKKASKDARATSYQVTTEIDFK